MAIVAPTGVAAINAGGVTIHSFFQLPPQFIVPGQKLDNANHLRKDKLQIIRGIDLLVIDEISMVRPDLLDAIDTRLREVRRNDRPFSCHPSSKMPSGISSGRSTTPLISSPAEPSPKSNISPSS